MNTRNVSLTFAAAAVLAYAGYYFFIRDHEAAQTQRVSPSLSSKAKSAVPDHTSAIAATNNYGTRQSSTLGSGSSKSLLNEYYESKSYKGFFEKYANFPTTSTERFLAEVAFQRCTSIGLIGPEKFLAISLSKIKDRSYGDIERNKYESSLKEFVSSCTEFYGAMTHAQQAERQKQFEQLDGEEATVEKLANRIKDKGPTGFANEVDRLLTTENPLLISMMGRVWEEAIRKTPGSFEGSIFSGISPEVASAAWQLAACEYGQDCGRNNEVVLYGCLYKLACSADSLRDYYQKYALSPDRFDQLLVTTGKIISALKQKKTNSLHSSTG